MALLIFIWVCIALSVIAEVVCIIALIDCIIHRYFEGLFGSIAIGAFFDILLFFGILLLFIL